MDQTTAMSLIAEALFALPGDDEDEDFDDRITEEKAKRKNEGKK